MSWNVGLLLVVWLDGFAGDAVVYVDCGFVVYRFCRGGFGGLGLVGSVGLWFCVCGWVVGWVGGGVVFSWFGFVVALGRCFGYWSLGLLCGCWGVGYVVSCVCVGCMFPDCVVLDFWGLYSRLGCLGFGLPQYVILTFLY